MSNISGWLNLFVHQICFKGCNNRYQVFRCVCCWADRLWCDSRTKCLECSKMPQGSSWTWLWGSFSFLSLVMCASKLQVPHPVVISCVFTLMQSYRFTVHGFQSSKTLPSVHVLATYTFGHKDLHICQMWVHQINASLDLQQGRPKDLLVCIVLS